MGWLQCFLHPQRVVLYFIKRWPPVKWSWTFLGIYDQEAPGILRNKGVRFHSNWNMDFPGIPSSLCLYIRVKIIFKEFPRIPVSRINEQWRLELDCQRSCNLTWQIKGYRMVNTRLRDPCLKIRDLIIKVRDCSTCSEPEIPRLLFRMPRFRDWADIFRDASLSHRPFYTPK